MHVGIYTYVILVTFHFAASYFPYYWERVTDTSVSHSQIKYFPPHTVTCRCIHKFLMKTKAVRAPLCISLWNDSYFNIYKHVTTTTQFIYVNLVEINVFHHVDSRFILFILYSIHLLVSCYMYICMYKGENLLKIVNSIFYLLFLVTVTGTFKLIILFYKCIFNWDVRIAQRVKCRVIFL